MPVMASIITTHERLPLIKEIDELSIGHSIIARAVFVGLDRAIRDMLELMKVQ